jgi:23S rRNA pseudouridine1911/1915/1917 synthase
VRGYLRERGREELPILLHRLDVDTSGVLLFALTAAANRALYRQMAGREVEKTYLCLAAGDPPDSLRVENQLKAGVRGRTVVIQTGGKQAMTEFRVLKRGAGISMVEARPRTGRTHQIRAHLAGEGYPLLGDRLYGGPAGVVLAGKTLAVRRHLLHAFRLVFRHPGTGENMVIEAPVPEDFKSIMGFEGDGLI